jgi:6-pyruvoyltetrahydropterin/6-carboxytetrahydropterin synthase
MMDFSLIKDILKEVVSELDHKILIPEKSNVVKIEKQKDGVKISSLGKNYVFPLSDCIFLPIDSTSAENLSKYILERLTKKTSFPKNVEGIEIGVDEGYGQGARILKKF